MNRYLFYFVLILISILIIKGIHFHYFHYEFYASLFGIIILNFAANDKIIISLENSIFNYLGKISYGIYMYHPIGIVFAIYIGGTININTNLDTLSFKRNFYNTFSGNII